MQWRGQPSTQRRQADADRSITAISDLRVSLRFGLQCLLAKHALVASTLCSLIESTLRMDFPSSSSESGRIQSLVRFVTSSMPLV